MNTYEYHIIACGNGRKLQIPLYIQMDESDVASFDRSIEISYIDPELQSIIEYEVGDRSYTLVRQSETTHEPSYTYVKPIWIDLIDETLSHYRLDNMQDHFIKLASENYQSCKEVIRVYILDGVIPETDTEINCICALFLYMIPYIFNYSIFDRYDILKYIRRCSGW